MNEQDLRDKYIKLISDETPDLWDNIKAALPEKKESFSEKLKRTFFGGSALRTAVSLTALAVIIAGAGGAASGKFRMGSAGGMKDAAPSASSYYGNEAVYNIETTAAYDPKDAEMMELAAEAENSASDGFVSGETGAAGDDEEASRKLIRDISVNIQTLEFDELISVIESGAANAGGYIENSSFYGSSYYYNSSRSAEYTVRIPSEKTDVFLEQLGGAGVITSRSESTRDVTLEYVDVESHVEALRAEQEQLMALMDKAGSVEEILSIENQLTYIRYELESYQSQLKQLANRVSYDTVKIYAEEVKETVPTEEPGFWENIGTGILKSLKGIGTGFMNFFSWIVIHLPYFAVLFVIIFVITIAVKKAVRKKRGQ